MDEHRCALARWDAIGADPRWPALHQQLAAVGLAIGGLKVILTRSFIKKT